MYKLEINQDSINKAIERNGSTDKEYIETDKKLIQDFVNNVNIFYDDCPNDEFWNKHNANDNTHKTYQILVTKGNKKILTEIAIPQNPFCYEQFDLDSVISALSFEVQNPYDYMEDSEQNIEKAVKRYKKVDRKIYDLFGESFYIFILGGST